MAVAARILEQAPPDALVELLLPNLWAGIAQESGAPANICVDSCLTLKYAYGQLGICAELALADLTLREANGDGVRHGTPEPSWNDDGAVFNGHCILLLPDSGRHVDATVGQFAKVREPGGPWYRILAGRPYPGQRRGANRLEQQLSHARIGQPDDRPDSACRPARRKMGME
ncbi:hypothetical protein ACIOHS_48320 [Streptomyces sp. NPDC088253]|uniref:hypothetical protein n=1 Tax=Streptomyces sp. NPDC088253 TaxID=3365846 RepID=UPI0037F30D8C